MQPGILEILKSHDSASVRVISQHAALSTLPQIKLEKY